MVIWNSIHPSNRLTLSVPKTAFSFWLFVIVLFDWDSRSLLVAMYQMWWKKKPSPALNGRSLSAAVCILSCSKSLLNDFVGSLLAHIISHAVLSYCVAERGNWRKEKRHTTNTKKTCNTYQRGSCITTIPHFLLLSILMRLASCILALYNDKAIHSIYYLTMGHSAKSAIFIARIIRLARFLVGRCDVISLIWDNSNYFSGGKERFSLLKERQGEGVLMSYQSDGFKS